MSRPDRIEFYVGVGLLLGMDSSMVPQVDSLINIQGVTWRVSRVTYAIDHSESPWYRQLRANVDLVRADERA